MPVPSAITDLSTTPGLNSPAGSEAPSLLDDYIRTLAAFIAQLRDGKADDGLAVLLSGAQTVGGVKTFTNGIVSNVTGNVTGTATSISGINPLANGGTGANYASSAALFNGIKQAASATATGVVELADTNEAQAGTDNTRAITPLGLRSALGAGGTAPVFAARAWCSFNASGSILSQSNVSSVTKLGTGRFRVTFATAMLDANFAPFANSDANATGGYIYNSTQAYIEATNSCIVSMVDFSGTARDPATFCSVVVFR